MSNATGPRFVTSRDGTRIACYVEGSGPPLVLSYGALSDHRFWRRLAPHLAGFTLHAIERRGRGESGDAPEHHPEREVEDIVAVHEAIGEPASVFAHSSGAVIALAAALKAPELVRRVVLYEPPMVTAAGLREDYTEELPRRLSALAAAGDRAGAIETFFREAPQLPEADIQRQKGGDLWRGLEPLAHTAAYDARLTLVYGLKELGDPAFDRPTLLLHGEVSPAWVSEGVKVLARNLGSSRVVELKGQGHVAMFTAPELLAGEIRRFLESDLT